MIYLVRIFLNISITGKIFPFAHCPWTIDTHMCGRMFVIILTFGLYSYLPYLLPSVYFALTPVVFLASFLDPIFQLILFSVVNGIWRVMIPCVCVLYSKANPKDNARILGELFFII